MPDEERLTAGGLVEIPPDLRQHGRVVGNTLLAHALVALAMNADGALG